MTSATPPAEGAVVTYGVWPIAQAVAAERTRSAAANQRTWILRFTAPYFPPGSKFRVVPTLHPSLSVHRLPASCVAGHPLWVDKRIFDACRVPKHRRHRRIGGRARRPQNDYRVVAPPLWRGSLRGHSH